MEWVLMYGEGFTVPLYPLFLLKFLDGTEAK